MSAQWTLLPGANAERASFGYGDGLIEAHTTHDGILRFSGPSQHWFDGGLEPTLTAIGQPLSDAIHDYWRQYPESDWIVLADLGQRS